MRETKIPIFNWEWMPERLDKIKLTLTGTHDIYAKKRTLTESNSTEYECRSDHIKELSRLFLMSQDKMRTIPSCLPDALKVLNFLDVPLTELGKATDTDGRTYIRWPKSLQFLSFSRNSITNLSSRVFMRPPEHLKTIWMKEQKLKDGSIIGHLPANALTYLKLSASGMERTVRADFDKLRAYNLLDTLDLSINNLTIIPDGMPNSLTTIDLHINKIKIINVMALQDFRQLKHLYLQRNLIEEVPLGLPASLQTLNLHSNRISSCDQMAFSHLKDLKYLDLSNNSLTLMPRNLPLTMETYLLQRNKISEIGDPLNYNFCANCKNFKLNGNPWSCNPNMVNFLIWANDHGSEQFSNLVLTASAEKFQCESSISTDLDGVRLEYLIRFMELVSSQGCTYNVTVLNCTGAALKEYFTMAPSMEKAYISNNPDLGNVPDFLFASQRKLKRLEVTRDGLTRIPYGMPRSITTLSLVGNNIDSITDTDAKALRNLTNIKVIYLGNNKLKTFMRSVIEPLSTLNLVSLAGNPLVCDCTLWTFTSWLREKLLKSDSVTQASSCGTCAEPAAVSGKDISQLQSYFNSTGKCIPSLCRFQDDDRLINCSYAAERELSPKGGQTILGRLPAIRPSQLWKSIDVTGRQLEASAIRLKHLSRLEHVILSNNSFQSFPLEGFPKSIIRLTLDRNNISTLPTPKQLRRYLPNLKYVDIRNNNIRSVNQDSITTLPLLTKGLLLHGNPLLCDCELRPLVGWITANKDEAQVVGNYKLNNLQCYGPKKLAGKFIIKLSDAEYCPDVSVSGIAAGLIGTVVLFTTVAIFVNIYLHKKRKKREKEDILQGFRELLQREAGFDDKDPETGVLEENDRFVYDAFVSYSPHEADSDFAMMLLDELEIRRQYKLCVHERDFVPGIGIADNIVECIGASKRIILILSRNFISSPWSQYEVRVALAELHQKRRSKLLIPVLLEDIDENGPVGGGVKIFLSLIQGIKIPNNKKESSWREFWNELSQAMPEQPIQEKAT